MNRTFSLILFQALSFHFAYAQSLPEMTQSSVQISAGYHYGFIIAHRGNIVALQKDHVKGFEVCVSKKTLGKKIWQQLYNYPEIGLKYFYFDLGNPEQIGFGQAVIPFVNFPICTNEKIHFGFSYGWGLGYVQRPFNYKTNYENVSIGSHVNSAIHFAAALKIKLFKQTDFNTGINLTHFSNGAIITPNQGINIASIQAGITRHFGDTKPLVKDSIPEFKKHYKNAVYIGTGIKQIYPVMGPQFFAVILSVSRFKQFTRKSAAGLALDYHYDNSLIYRLEDGSLMQYGFVYGTRAGISAGYEMILSDFSMMIQMGGYFYNQLKTDGNVYHRLSLKYHFHKNYFVCFNLKSHWAKADFFETGVGIRF
ncbi:MAG: acyloxyacyl hydrolase [Bacteroidia bacterium]